MNELPIAMNAAVLTGHGGPEVLQYQTDFPVPTPAAGEVMIQVGAAGVNNTDVNTRIGWYSKSEDPNADDASWSG